MSSSFCSVGESDGFHRPGRGANVGEDGANEAKKRDARSLSKKSAGAINLRQTWLKTQQQQQHRANAMICPDGNSILFLSKRPPDTQGGGCAAERGGRTGEGRTSTSASEAFVSFEDPGFVIDARMTDVSYPSSTANSRLSKRAQADANQDAGMGGVGGPEKRLSFSSGAGSSRCSSSSPLKKKPGTAVLRESDNLTNSRCARTSAPHGASADHVQTRQECTQSEDRCSAQVGQGIFTEGSPNSAASRITLSSSTKEEGESLVTLRASGNIPDGSAHTVKARVREDRETGGGHRRRSFSSSCMSKVSLSLDPNSQRLLAQLLPRSGSVSRSYHGGSIASAGRSVSVSSCFPEGLPEPGQSALETSFFSRDSRQDFQGRFRSDGGGEGSPGLLRGISRYGADLAAERGWREGGLSGYREPQTVLREDFGCDTLYHELELEQLDALQSAVSGRCSMRRTTPVVFLPATLSVGPSAQWCRVLTGCPAGLAARGDGGLV